MFTHLAAGASRIAGSAGMFLGSLLAFLAWLGAGVWLGWSADVHLWPTSLLTWLTWILVVLIQNSQTRQEDAMQRKLDEMIRAVPQADNRLIGVEKAPPGRDPGPPAARET